MPTGTEPYYDAPRGDLWLRPVEFRMRVTFSAGGATATKSTTRRQSDPTATVAVGTTGQYLFTGLPKGDDYNIIGCELIVPAGTQLASSANVTAFSATAGTLTVQVRQTSDGAAAAPADTSQLFLTLEVESGAFV